MGGRVLSQHPRVVNKRWARPSVTVGRSVSSTTTVVKPGERAGFSGISDGRSRGGMRRSVQGAEQSVNTPLTATSPKRRKGCTGEERPVDPESLRKDSFGGGSGTGSEAASVAGDEPVPVELSRWRVPRTRQHGSVQRVASGIYRSLEVLGGLKVRPAYKNQPGVLVRDLCDESRSAYRDMEMGIDRLQDMVEEGGAEKRCADLKEQVRGLKAALARVERLVRLGGGVVRPAPASPPI